MSAATNTAEAHPSTSSILLPHSNRAFLHNGGAIAGLAVALGIIVIGLALFVFLWRRKRRLNYRLGRTPGESDYLRASVGWGLDARSYAPEAIAAQSDDRLPAGYSTERVTTNDNGDTWSFRSDTSSRASMRQSAMNAEGSEEYASSSYPASLLPAYAGRNFSPPSYTDLSRIQTSETHDNMAFGEFYQGVATVTRKAVVGRVE
jgi:hypothetical protein